MKIDNLIDGDLEKVQIMKKIMMNLMNNLLKAKKVF